MVLCLSISCVLIHPLVVSLLCLISFRLQLGQSLILLGVNIIGIWIDLRLINRERVKLLF